MRTVPVSSERNYQIEIGTTWQSSLSDWVEGRKQVVLITTENLRSKISLTNELANVSVIEIPEGEAGKTPQMLEATWNRLAELEVERNSLIIGLGGGAVTDHAGFAAATWLRGIDWVAVPTTIAGMVDASIGGKTGINSQFGKNLIGAFHSPLAVLVDLYWTKSLSNRDFAAGLAEAIKCGFIKDQEILKLLTGKKLLDLRENANLLEELIERSAAVKAEVVSNDFKENELREILNYGHTLGHAIEVDSNYQIRHGEAISIGMVFVAELAQELCGLGDSVVEKHRSVLNSFDLPTSYKRQSWPNLLKIMQSDKKVRNGEIRFVALSDFGQCTRITAPTSDALERAYAKIAQ